MWQIHVLGEVKICFNNIICDEFTLQESLLLGGLALAPQHSLTRSELVELIWSDEDCPEYTGHRLRQILYNLRTKLRQKFHSDDLLPPNNKGSISLHSDVTIDAEVFAAAISAAKKADTQDAEEKSLAEALEIYGGQLLSQHLTFFHEERERLSEQYRAAQKRLAELSQLSFPTFEPAPIHTETETNGLAAPVAPLFRSIPTKGRRRHYRMVAACAVLLACIVWAGKRAASVPTTREITAANAFTVLDELHQLRVGGTATETAAGRHERMKQHAELCVQLLETADKGFWGPEEAIWQECLRTSESSQEMAFNWCLQNDPEKALQMSGVLASHKNRQAFGSNPKQDAKFKEEGRQYIEKALARSPNSLSLVKARALRRYTQVAYSVKSITDCRTHIKYAEQSLQICRYLKDPKGEAESLRLLGLATATYGQLHEAKKQHEAALKQYEEVLEVYRTLRDPIGEAQTYLNMANLGGLRLPLPEYWVKIADWARKSLHLFRQAKSQHGAGRALKCYETYVERIKPPFARERAQWQRLLMEDYCVEAEQTAGGQSSDAVELRKKILRLAAELQDNKKALEQIGWFYGRWEQFRAHLSAEQLARFHGAILHLDTINTGQILTAEERHRLKMFGQECRSQPRIRSEFEGGSTMSLNDVAAFISQRSH